MRRYIERILIFLLGAVCATSIGAASANTEGFYTRLDVLAEVLGYIQSQYVHEVDSQKLIYGAIEGAIDTLDEYSTFFPREDYQHLLESTEGEFGGIGVELRSADGRATGAVEVFEVHPNSPARHAGIKPGDFILRIDAEEITVDTAVDALRGPVGTRVRLEVRRAGMGDKTWPYTLVRQWVRVSPVEHKMLGDGIFYVRLKLFPRRVALDLSKLLRETKPRALLLDLRDNPGGLFDEAVEVCDLFLRGGLIVTSTGRIGAGVERRLARQHAAQGKIPLAVLVNEGSASAAEVVAGALQDRERARIFGSKTYGKGTVQKVIDLSDGSGLKLTIAHYRTPSGADIEGTGITPDESFDSALRSNEQDAAEAAAERWVRAQL